MLGDSNCRLQKPLIGSKIHDNLLVRITVDLANEISSSYKRRVHAIEDVEPN